MMTALTHALDRTVIIQAPPATVFRYFTDTSRWAAWWGAGSTVDARQGGRIFIRHPDGTEVVGEVLDIDTPRRFVFTYGFVKGEPIAPGRSRVSIDLAAHSDGTRLTLRHELDDAAVRDEHVQGWRFQLSLFANVVANEVQSKAAGIVDDWFAAWTIADDSSRKRALAAIAAPALQFRDRFGNIDGIDDLVPHIGAALRFLPGLTMRRQGEIRQCQGMVLADWAAAGADGQPRGAGTNVFVFGPDGLIRSVTGFWG